MSVVYLGDHGEINRLGNGDGAFKKQDIANKGVARTMEVCLVSNDDARI